MLNIIFRTGPRATYRVLAGDLVPAGTTLVIPAVVCHAGHAFLVLCTSALDEKLSLRAYIFSIVLVIHLCLFGYFESILNWSQKALMSVG